MEEEVKYLDWEGLQQYHGKIEEELAKKANAADLADVATSGDYEDLINQPTKVSAFDNDAGYLTSEIDNTNGHAFIEIGGLKWATMNIGAEDITDVGLYFQWGDIEGFTSDQVGVDKQFTWNDYKFNPSGDGSTFTKYNATDEKTVLDLEDDPVAHAWGSDWRTPTYAEFQAFYAAVDTEWTNDYEDSGIAGLICTDKEDESKVIFFPAAGLCNQGSVISDNTEGFYWSKSLSNTVNSGIGIGFDDSATDWNLAQSRCYGFCLRGILNGPAKRLVTGVTQAEKDIWNSKVSTQELEEAMEDVELSAGKGIVIENNTVSIDDTVEVVITLNSAPTSSTLTYTKNSIQYNFKVGDEVRVPDLNVPTGNHGYIYYKLFDLVTIEQTTTAFWCAIGAGSSEGGSFYTPTLAQAPTESTLTYTKDGQTLAFEIGQFCRVADADAPLGYEFYQLYDLAQNGTVAKWNACPTKMNPTYTPPTPLLTPPVYTGSPQPILEGGSSGDGNIQYSMDGSNWSSTIPTVTNAGTYTVYWRLQGDGMHSDVPPTAVTVTMLPKEVEDPDITLSISEYTYDGNACTPTVTLKDGDTTIDSSEYIVTYSDNTNAGTATITITNVANGNYVINASTTFTIDKAAGSVTTAPVNRASAYNGSAQPVADAGVGTGTMMYRLGDSGDFSSSMPTVTNAGTYALYYYSAESANYLQSSTASIEVSIAKIAPVYTAPTAKTLTYTGSAQDLLNAGSSSDGTIQYSDDGGTTWSTTIPQGTNAGSYILQWKLVGDNNHNDTTAATINVLIAKADPSYTAPTAKLLTYNTSAQELLNAGSTSDGTIQYSTDESTWNTTIPSQTNTGTYTTYWRIVGDSNHNDKASASISTTISPKVVSSPTIILSQSNYTYDGNACQPTVTVKDGNVTIASSEYTVSYSDNINVGTATVTITDNTGGNYTVNGTENFTISKVTPTVTAPTAKTLTYTGSAQALINAGSTDWGTLQYSLDDTNYSTSIPDGTNADTYTVYYKVVGNSNINDVAAQTVSVTIDKATPTYTAPTAKSLVYSGSAQDLLNAGSTNHGTIQYSADGSTWSTSIPQGTNADDYTPQWKLIGDSNHSDIAATTINVSIAKANPIYTAPIAKSGLVYNATGQDLLNAGSTSDGTISYSEDDKNWSSSIPQGTNAGDYTVYWKLTGDSNHSDIASTTVNVSISKVTPTVTAPTAKSGLEYNSTAQALVTAGSTNYGELQYSIDGTNYSTSVATGTNAGSYTVYYKVVGNSNVNDVAATSINVSIAKGTPTVTAPTAKTGLTYNGLAQELVNAGSANFGTLKYSIGVETIGVNNNGHTYVDLGLPSGTLWATMNVGANVPEDYGNYYMYGKGATVYNSSDSEYTGTENPLSLSLDTARQVWNGDWHLPTKTQFEELTSNTTYEWTTINSISGGKFTAANGNYVFFPAAGLYVNGNHAGVGNGGNCWSSTPADSGDAYSFIYFPGGKYMTGDNGRNTGLSVRGVIDGASTIIVPSTYSSSIPTGTNAGTYYVYWKIEGDDNINEVSGSTAIEVTISKINSTITVSGNKTTLNADIDETNTLTISVAGGATPTITSSNTSVATVNGYTISAVDGGTTTITISTPTDDNHNGDTYSYTLTVTSNFVDLGLPSGRKWAKGFLEPDDSGGGYHISEINGTLFSWGNITEQITFSDAIYNGTPGKSLTASIASNDASHDAALARLGAPCRLPTKEDIQELVNYTNVVYSSRYIRFINKNDSTKIIRFRLVVPYVISFWSSSYYDSDKAYCYYTNFQNGNDGPGFIDTQYKMKRSEGACIAAVK